MRFDRLALVVAMALFSVIAPLCRANAQQTAPIQPQPTSPSGPFRDIFARPTSMRPDGESLTLTMAGYGGYDDNVISDSLGAGTDPSAQAGGSSVLGGDAGWQYVKTIARRMSFSANGQGSYRYFPDRSSLSQSSINGGAGINVQVGKRTRLLLDQSVAYQPYYQLGLFPTLGEPDIGLGLPSNLDYAVLKRKSILLATNASVEQNLTRKSSLIFNGQFFNQTLDSAPPSETDPEGEPQNDVRGFSAGVHFRRQITRYLTLRLGDEYRRFVYPSPTRRVLQGNNIDAGVDYARSLSFSRHTSLSITTGSSIVSFDGRQFADITGAVSLSHLFTRNWRGQLAYNRNLNFVETLNQPLFADSANAALEGIIHRRLLMTISGGYVSGRLGLGREANDRSTLRTGTGAFSLVYAFTNYLRANFDYSYFQYHFSNDAVLPDGLRPSFDRNSVRGGLSLVLPLLR
jgi:hypothetical protein